MRGEASVGGWAMGRVKRVLGAGIVAVAVSVVAAGPAVAAKGGNNDNAHACQQGGHQGLFETETGNPFMNAGDCASHGAKGSAFTGLSIDMSAYDCNEGPHVTCYGTLTGSGLQPGSMVGVVFTFDQGGGQQNPSADGSGNLSYPLDIVCDESEGANNVTSVSAFGTTAQGQDVETPDVGTPCD
jgi:hypothetical protein